MKMYELPQELRNIEEAIELNDGVITEEIQQRLDAFRQKESQYFPQIASLIDEYKVSGEALLERAKQLKEMGEKKLETGKRLSYLTMTIMDEMNQGKLQFDTVVLRIQNNPPSLKITDEEKIPEKFKVVKAKISKPQFDTMVNDFGMEFIKQEVSFQNKEILDVLKERKKIEAELETCEDEVVRDQLNERLAELDVIEGAEIQQGRRLVIKGA